MIEVIFKKNNKLIKFSSKGHANFNENGRDLICSAVSSIIIGGLNALQNKDSFVIKIKSGYLDVESLIDASEHDIIVFETIYIQLKTIEENYSKYLKVI